jgi:hypothetical protein
MHSVLKPWCLPGLSFGCDTKAASYFVSKAESELGMPVPKGTGGPLHESLDRLRKDVICRLATIEANLKGPSSNDISARLTSIEESLKDLLILHGQKPSALTNGHTNGHSLSPKIIDSDCTDGFYGGLEADKQVGPDNAEYVSVIVEQPQQVQKDPPKPSFSRASTSTNLNEKDDANLHWRRMMRKTNAKQKHLHPITKSAKKQMQDSSSIITKVIQSNVFEIGSLLVVLCNAGYLMYEMHYLVAEHEKYESSAEWVFRCVFTLELLFRLVGYDSTIMAQDDLLWNIFDSFIVATMWGEVLIEAVTTDSGFQPPTVLRVVRATRVVRITRIIRVLKAFRELRVMISGILSSMRSLFWAAVIATLIFCVFGMVLTQATLDYCFDNDAWHHSETERIREKFGSLGSSMLSLYETMAGGISWGDLVDVLEILSPAYVAVYLVFTALTVVAVMNVVTGIFVENAMQGAQADNEAQIQLAMQNKQKYVDHISAVFKELDSSGKGSINLEEFENGIEDVRLVAYFERLGLDLSDVKQLFVLLDKDHAGTIDIEEFLIGCLRMQGQAKSMDMCKLLYEMEWCVHSMEGMALKTNSLCRHFGLKQVVDNESQLAVCSLLSHDPELERESTP